MRTDRQTHLKSANGPKISNQANISHCKFRYFHATNIPHPIPMISRPLCFSFFLPIAAAKAKVLEGILSLKVYYSFRMMAAVFIIPEMESSSWRWGGYAYSLYGGCGIINIDYILIYRCKNMALLTDSPLGQALLLFIALRYYTKLNLKNKFIKAQRSVYC